MMQERGVEVDHSSLNRWVRKYIPVLDQVFRLHRAVDKAGHTVDFLLTAKRDRKAAARFLRKAIDQCGMPEKITIDKSGANTAAIEEYNTDNEASIELRQVKYLNNILEQDHRAIKRMTRPMLGFKSFWSAAITPAAQSYSLAG
jgi:putative transposase